MYHSSSKAVELAENETRPESRARFLFAMEKK
jgi:hypothetical protein